MAEDFATEHKKMDFDFKKVTLAWLGEADNRAEIKKYCMNDVIVLKELYFAFMNSMRQVIPSFRESDIKTSTAATAFNLFQTYFNKDKFVFGNQPSQHGALISEYERASYFGGMTQVFKHHGSDVVYYDFVSMYPSVMYDSKFPVTCGQLSALQADENSVFDASALFIVTEFEFKPQVIITNLPVRD